MTVQAKTTQLSASRAFLVLVRILAPVLAAIVWQRLRRLVRGPAVSSWAWNVERRVTALRAFNRSAWTFRESPEVLGWLGHHFDPPLPRRLRTLIRVDAAALGKRPVEWITRVGAGDELTDIATILYLHGGGYIAGSPVTHRRFTSRLAWATSSRVAVVDYRLAPQHRFPAAVIDAEAAYHELLKAGVSPKAIFVAGDSAGGGLAAALLLRLRDRGTPLPAGAILFSPYTDLEHTAATIEPNANTDYLPLEGLRGPTPCTWEMQIFIIPKPRLSTATSPGSRPCWSSPAERR